SARQVLLNTEKVNLSPYCEKALSAEPVGIKQGINLTYKPVGTESLILPFTDRTIWFRVTVLGDSTQSRILEWENNLSEQVTFFIPDSSGGFREYSGGSFTPYSERSDESTGLSAVFQLKKGVPVTLYVRVQSQRAC